jgi:hypothetical protein
MSRERADETDLTFQAAVTLDTTVDNHVVTLARADREERFSIKDIWTGHRTLLVRLANHTARNAATGQVWHDWAYAQHRHS